MKYLILIVMLVTSLYSEQVLRRSICCKTTEDVRNAYQANNTLKYMYQHDCTSLSYGDTIKVLEDHGEYIKANTGQFGDYWCYSATLKEIPKEDNVSKILQKVKEKEDTKKKKLDASKKKWLFFFSALVGFGLVFWLVKLWWNSGDK